MKARKFMIFVQTFYGLFITPGLMLHKRKSFRPLPDMYGKNMEIRAGETID